MNIVKKIIAGATSAVMLASASSAVFAAGASAYPEANGKLHGDVDGNRVVNYDDYTTLKEYILGMSNSGVKRQYADINEDGVVNTLDLVGMMRILKLDLHCTDSINSNYQFTYNGKTYTAVYTENRGKGLYNWKIIDSYSIAGMNDMLLICQLLKDRHPIPTSAVDGINFRSADNMAKEWDAHNYVYSIMPAGSSWSNRAKDVDIDPTGDGMDRNNFYYYV